MIKDLNKGWSEYVSNMIYYCTPSTWTFFVHLWVWIIKCSQFFCTPLSSAYPLTCSALSWLCHLCLPSASPQGLWPNMSDFDGQIQATWKIYVVPHQVLLPVAWLRTQHFWPVTWCDGRCGGLGGGRLVCWANEALLLLHRSSCWLNGHVNTCRIQTQTKKKITVR